MSLLTETIQQIQTHLQGGADFSLRLASAKLASVRSKTYVISNEQHTD